MLTLNPQLFNMTQTNNITSLTFTLNETEIPSTNICFTGDAIATLHSHKFIDNNMNLEDWEWYKEKRGGNKIYVIKNRKK